MAGICIRYADSPNVALMEFACDTVDECVNEAPTMTKPGTGVFKKHKQFAPMGSTCIVGNHGSTKLYMLFSDGWQEV